jgi:hypothetical protein
MLGIAAWVGMFVLVALIFRDSVSNVWFELLLMPAIVLGAHAGPWYVVEFLTDNSLAKASEASGPRLLRTVIPHGSLGWALFGLIIYLGTRP